MGHTTPQCHNDGLILVSPVHPVTEGDPVTLSCRDKHQKLLSNVFFYHNDKRLHNDSREELNISAVSKSDEGFYKCQHSGKESPQSWMSVRALSSPATSSFPVMLIVGPVVGVVLIVLLLLLWRCRRCRDLWCIRMKKSKGSGQTSDPNHGVNHSESHVYSSPLQVAGESTDVTYSLIQVNKVDQKRRPHEPEDGVVYSEVKTGAAGDQCPAD